jgi:hypothetical protein
MYSVLLGGVRKRRSRGIWWFGGNGSSRSRLVGEEGEYLRVIGVSFNRVGVRGCGTFLDHLYSVLTEYSIAYIAYST